MRNALLSFIVFCFFACHYEYAPNIEEPRLVLNAIMSQDSGILAHLSRSTSAVGTIHYNDLLVTNGVVELIDAQNGQVIPLQYQQKGWYANNTFLPIVGRKYFMRAKSEGLPDVTSESIEMPPPPELDSIRFALNPTLDGVYPPFKYFNMKLRLKDVGNQTNFYLYEPIAIYQDSFTTPCNFIPNTALLGSSCSFNSYDYKDAFSDQCFASASIMIDMDLSYIYWSKYHQNLQGVIASKIFIDFQGISESYFNYLKNQEQPESYIRAFEEPKLRYTNIKNGHGIFIAKNTKRIIYIP